MCVCLLFLPRSAVVMSEEDKKLYTLMQRVHTVRRVKEGEERVRRTAAKEVSVKKKAAVAALFEGAKKDARKRKFKERDLKARDRAKVARKGPE